MKLLDGIRVLDLTNVLSGPFATLHLALLGAEVIKIENPTDGDLARKLGNVPKLQPGADGHELPGPERQQEVADPQPEGRGRQGDLPEAGCRPPTWWWRTSGPDVMTRLGLGYEVLCKINPRLVYCAISGFGQTGPDAYKPAYDQIIQGLSGVMAVNGDERLNPLRCGFPVCDTVGGLNAAFAIMAALYHRERTGEGQFIDVALLDSIMPLMGWVAANLLIGGQQPVLDGQRQLHRRALRHLQDAGRLHQHRRQQAGAVGGAGRRAGRAGAEDRPALPGARHPQEEPHAAHAAARGEADRQHDRALGGGAERQRRPLRRRSWRWRPPWTQPQVQHRQVLADVAQPTASAKVKLFGLTAKFSKTPAQIEMPPPRLRRTPRRSWATSATSRMKSRR